MFQALDSDGVHPVSWLLVNERIRVGLLIIVWATTGRATAATEPWSDPALPVTHGLWCWHDAGRQPSAWEAHRRVAPVAGQSVDISYDGSGNQRHVQQRVRGAQPRLWLDEARGVYEFDGNDDYLGAEREFASLDDITLYFVVAPRSNAGGFRGFFSAHAPGSNDYLSGLNVDLGDSASTTFAQCNVEGVGFQGMRNLLPVEQPLGRFVTLEVVCGVGDEGVRLAVDGQAAGARPRTAGSLRFDNWALGARCFSNTEAAPAMAGYFAGDLAELIVFDRQLTAVERAQVNRYLDSKYTGLTARLAVQRRGHRLQPLAATPPLQMLVPGFVVRQLPLQLTNINNVRYRADGMLVALAYNGNVHLLRDTDGDGLEDTASLFFEAKERLRGPIGLVVTPPGYPHGQGVLVASKGKISLLVDRDGDDRADEEKIVATGWSEIPQNVDAVGVALGDDGSIYFGLGCANFANGYLLDESGQSHYDLKSERGTIQRVSPDWQQRETICTGMRFPVSLGFNRAGDLFAAEQEGATWLANGNPLDELLHIRPGRHFGFPPRHPRHLPDVIDEPSTYDYGPQHQSTCGMIFNLPSNGGPVFGPTAWTDDVIVCGESRGKLFRTTLVKGPSGYVAQNQVIGALHLLTVDACVSPTGKLIVACHSGPPDWGTGPEGTGQLFQVAYADTTVSQPIATYPAGPRMIHVEFDRPLDLEDWRGLAGQVRLEYGDHVRAGDRFETLRPPYAVVERQLATLRHDLPVVSAQVTADRRTLQIETAPQAQATHYALTLPSDPVAATGAGVVPQLPGIDLGYDLSGVAARWQDATGHELWSGWLPHLDLDVARHWTRGSATHERLWRLMEQPGQLQLSGQLDLYKLLQPLVQPGSQLDFEPEPEDVTIRFESHHLLQLQSDDPRAAVTADLPGKEAQLTLRSESRQLLPFTISIGQDALLLRPAEPSERESVDLRVSFSTSADDRPRSLATRRMFVPWATLAADTPEESRSIPELAGGDWREGQRLFQDEKLACAKCHQLRGAGGVIGPSLANLIHRDVRSVKRDILDPNAALNPDHLGWNVVTHDGRQLTGVLLRSDEQRIVLGGADGREQTIARAEIETLELATTSVMPGNFAELLSATQLRDLLTYLMTEPPAPAADPPSSSDLPQDASSSRAVGSDGR